MKKYDNYKNSGVEWLGEIPEHWEVKKVFHYFKAEKGKNAAILTKDYCGKIEGKFPVYSGQTENNGIMSSINQFEFDFEDDGCLFTTTVGAKAMTVSFLKSKFSLSQNCMIIVKRKKEIYSKFYFYHFQPIFHFFRSQIPDHMQASFRMEDLYKLKFYLPPFQEQTAIANFLDDKTTKIDQAIAIKQQQIELLKERRQILIHKAVTRGLNENVKLKDSGVEWIGEIPEHWQLKNLKFLKANIKNAFVDGPFGSNLKSEHFIENGEVYVVESGFITTGVFINKTFKTISEKHYQTIKRSTCSEKDVIIAKIGANYGMAAELPLLDKKAVVSGNSLKITLDNKKVLNNLFVKLLGLSKQLGGFEDIVNASAQPALSLGGLNNLKLPIAPIEEQPEISRYIENLEQKIATAISLKEQEIEKLKEYKMSLIDGVVTGKVRVIS